MDTAWSGLLDILILLAVALLLGTLAEQLRQSALLGYLAAGALVGPYGLGFVGDRGHVEVFAELGVALLLFSIGLEFSFSRLRRLGRHALVSGTLQVALTMLVGAAGALVFGFSWRSALTIGAIFAMSSTACVIRLLMDRAAIDSLYGRRAVAVVLLQDAAVIPLMLLTLFLSGEGTVKEAALALGRAGVMVVVLMGVFVGLVRYVVPLLVNVRRWTRNREFPILLAIVLALGSAYAAHGVGLSPALGAFLAGVILSASPFAAQIRADVSSLRTVLVTLFFASVGMLGEPRWVMAHAGLVLGVVALVVAGKTLIAAVAVRLGGASPGVAVATGLTVAQVGEFSFVLAGMARGGALDEPMFRLIVTTTIVTLFLTPFLIRAAPSVAYQIDRRRRRRPRSFPHGEIEASEHSVEAPTGSPIFIVGYGPAGQGVAAALHREYADRLCVIELSPANAARARRDGLRVQIGDASQQEVLDHAHVELARAVIITIPDPATCRTIIHLCRTTAPDAVILARARYHVTRWDLHSAGATDVVDEEQVVGAQLALAAQQHLSRTSAP